MIWLSRGSPDPGQGLWPCQDTETRSSRMGWKFHVYSIKNDPEKKIHELTCICRHFGKPNKSKLTPKITIVIILSLWYFTSAWASPSPWVGPAHSTLRTIWTKQCSLFLSVLLDFLILIPHSTQNFEKFILVFSSSLSTHSEMWFRFYLWWTKKYKFSLHHHFWHKASKTLGISWMGWGWGQKEHLLLLIINPFQTYLSLWNEL